MATNGYILVKDKDGKMKYFKDGRYYSPDEVRVAAQAQRPQAQTAEEKRELKPIYSFDSGKRAAPPIPVRPLAAAAPLAGKKPEVIEGSIPMRKLPSETIEGSIPVKELHLNDLKKPAKAPAPPAVKSTIRKKEDWRMEDVAPQAEWSGKRETDQKLIDEMVNNVIQRLKIKFSDPAIESRFRGFLATYFRGVRQAKEIGYLLGLPKMSGGLELPKDKITIILAVLEQAAQDFHKARRDVAAKPFDVAMMKKAEDVEHQLTAPVPAKTEPKSVPEKIIASTGTDNSSARPRVFDFSKQAAAAVFTAKPEVMRPAPAAKPMAVKSEAKPANAGRPQIRDLHVERRLVGPVEELEIMDLTNLRQLGKTAEEMQAQLKKKFDFLSEQALVKKVEGVQAWKRSPVFKLYIAMTYEGLRERKTIADVIRARQIANNECLTLSEYEMIGRLNAEIAL